MKARICKEKHWNVHLRFFLVMMGDLLFSVSVLAQSNLIFNLLWSGRELSLI